MMDFVIEGDLAYLSDEWERLEHRRKWDREHRRHRYATDPEYRERIKTYMRAWKQANRERVNAYNREWMRRRRGPAKPRVPVLPVTYVIGSLHNGACSGPTRATGCRCHKIRVVSLAQQQQAEGAA